MSTNSLQVQEKKFSASFPGMEIARVVRTLKGWGLQEMADYMGYNSRQAYLKFENQVQSWTLEQQGKLKKLALTVMTRKDWDKLVDKYTG